MKLIYALLIILLASLALALPDSPTTHYTFNNNYNDSISGNSLAPIGSGTSFNATAKLGSHSLSCTASGGARNASVANFTNGNVNHTIMLWVYQKTVSVEEPTITLGAATPYQLTGAKAVVGPNRLGFSGGNAAVDYTVNAPWTYNAWEHRVYVYYSNRTKCVYLNATLLGCGTGSEDLNTQFGGIAINDQLAGSYGHAQYDDVRIYWNYSANLADVELVFNNGAGSEDELPVSGGAGVVAGLFSTAYANISLNLSEGQDFFVWANYSYDNSSVVYPLGGCNYSANGIIDEHYNRSVGSNTSVCLSGCDSTNYTQTFSGLSSDGFTQDVFKVKACRNTPAADSSLFVGSNCSAAYEVSYADISICSNGYTNISITDANCSGGDVILNVWTNAASTAKRGVIVDNFVGVDRLHNHSGSLTWNSTLEVFISDSVKHEYYTHGSKTINISCFGTQYYIENVTTSLSITVVNKPPTVSIQSAWWWLLGSTPASFVSDLVGKYPWSSTFNVTYLVDDDDLDTVITYLNFSNGTNIHTFKNVTYYGNINYSSSNFTTALAYLNGSESYVFHLWANDSSNNVSEAKKNFTVVDLPPVASWLNITGTTYTTKPLTFNFTCVDPELRSVNGTVWVNTTYNTSGLNLTGYTFNTGVGTYGLSVGCNDGIWSSANDSIVFVYNPTCVLVISGVTDSLRYRNNTVNLSASCSNGVNLSVCSFSINKFAKESFNCAGENIILELGWNSMDVNVTDSGGQNTSTSVRVSAKRLNDSGFAGYVVIIILFLGLSGLFWAYFRFMKVGAFAVLLGVGGCVLGFSLVGFSLWIGGFVIVASILFVIYEVFRG